MTMNSSIKYVPKGWGYEKWISNSEKYCGKLLFVFKDRRCSYHYHKLKDETFYVQSGAIRLYYGTNDDYSNANHIVLVKGDKFHVAPGLRHQMLALEDAEVFEFSTQHFDDDSYRVVDGDQLN